MNFALIFLIIIFSISLFFYGKSKTRSLALQNNLKLNALPKFYGYYLVLWCSIPSLVFLLIWTLFEPIIIKSIIIDNAAKLGANISDNNNAPCFLLHAIFTIYTVLRTYYISIRLLKS